MLGPGIKATSMGSTVRLSAVFPHIRAAAIRLRSSTEPHESKTGDFRYETDVCCCKDTATSLVSVDGLFGTIPPTCLSMTSVEACYQRECNGDIFIQHDFYSLNLSNWSICLILKRRNSPPTKNFGKPCKYFTAHVRVPSRHQCIPKLRNAATKESLAWCVELIVDLGRYHRPKLLLLHSWRGGLEEADNGNQSALNAEGRRI